MLAASAVSYGTYYKGTPQYGVVYTTSSAEATNIGSGGAMTFSPIGSTSLSGNRGILTSASDIYGGVTTYDMSTGGRNHVPIKAGKYPPSSNPNYNKWCHYVWIDNPDDEVYGGYWICTECGMELEDGGKCTEEHHYVPLADGREVWLFMIAMAVGYGVYKTREKHHTETSVMRT